MTVVRPVRWYGGWPILPAFLIGWRYRLYRAVERQKFALGRANTPVINPSSKSRILLFWVILGVISGPDVWGIVLFLSTAGYLPSNPAQDFAYLEGGMVVHGGRA